MAINADDVNAAIEAARHAWIEALAAQIAEAAMEGLSLLDYEISGVADFGLFEARAVEYARAQAALKVGHILETTRTEVQAIIAEAIENGWSTNQTADALTEIYSDFETRRALVIARTETASSINWGKHEAAKDTAVQLDMQIEREWSAVRDGRTRPTHVAVNGTKKKLTEAFNVGGFPAMFPGDPNLPPEESICCRCALIFSEVKTETTQ